MNKTVAALLSQEMTRKEFLSKLGLALLALTGINSLIKLLSRPTPQQQETGFGSGPYGK
jgi:hypothetical protein